MAGSRGCCTSKEYLTALRGFDTIPHMSNTANIQKVQITRDYVNEETTFESFLGGVVVTIGGTQTMGHTWAEVDSPQTLNDPDQWIGAAMEAISSDIKPFERISAA